MTTATATERLLESTTAGGVRRITLNRPEIHNAFDAGLIADLDGAFTRAEADADVRAVVLAASGKSFSAGADLNWMKAAANYTPDENRADAGRLAALLYRMNFLPKPLIGLVQGAAFGGGVGLVSCCDIALASPRATFSLSEVRLGLIPAVISPYVVAALGARAARRYFQTGERFDATTAHRLGLVHEIVEEDQLEAKAQAVLAELALNGPKAMADAKALVRYVAGAPVTAELVAGTVDRIVATRSGAEGKEGVAAFLEKRTPSFRVGAQGA